MLSVPCAAGQHTSLAQQRSAKFGKCRQGRQLICHNTHRLQHGRPAKKKLRYFITFSTHADPAVEQRCAATPGATYLCGGDPKLCWGEPSPPGPLMFGPKMSRTLGHSLAARASLHRTAMGVTD